MNKLTKIESKKINAEPKKRGTPSRDILYTEAAKYALRAIEVVVELIESGDNSNVKLGAAKTILAKTIPDITANEISGVKGQQLQVKIIKDYVSPRGWDIASSKQENASISNDSQNRYVFGEKQMD